MGRRLIFLLITAGLALTAAYLVHTALQSKEESIQALRRNTVMVVGAARNLSPGERIDAAAVRLITWPRDQVPPGAFTGIQPVIGRVVKNPLTTNQPIVAAALLETERTGGVLPLMIPPGMRAMSIAVDDVSDMAGFVLPYSRVDVLVSVGIGGGPGAVPGAAGEVSKIVLQNIKVVAVAQSLEAGLDQPRQVKVVTLLVTPVQAERLAAASRLGTLTLAMRNFADQDLIATSGVTVPALLGIQPLEQAPALPLPPPPPLDHRRTAERRRAKSVEVIRGIEHQMVNFSGDGRSRMGAAPTSTAPSSESTNHAPPTE